jgi:DNA-binding NarL/FixJ family response regulator
VPLPKALVGIAAAEIRDGVARAAAPVLDVVRLVMSADETAEALEFARAEFDVALIDVAALRTFLRRMRRGRSDPALSAPPTILVLQLAELQDALALLHLSQGIVFWDEDPAKVESMSVVALDGYSTAPASLLPDLVTDRVRIGLIERLTEIELQVLELLGAALSNKAIAERLDISEPVAKSLVRTVLTKLRLKNRTEAAVLVARWRSPVETVPAREQSVSAEPAAS